MTRDRWCRSRKFGKPVRMQLTYYDYHNTIHIVWSLAGECKIRDIRVREWEQRPQSRINVCCYQKHPNVPATILECCLVQAKRRAFGITSRGEASEAATPVREWSQAAAAAAAAASNSSSSRLPHGAPLAHPFLSDPGARATTLNVGNVNVNRL